MIKKLPDTLVIILFILLLFTLLTWLIPSGEYQREIVNGREVVVPGSYQEVASSPQGLFAFLQAPIKGIIGSAQIIGFVFLVGGAFSIINRTGAITVGLRSVIEIGQQKAGAERWILPVLIALFSLAGATFGMSEEVLVFVMITLPLAKSMGYDNITGAAIPFVGAGAGFAGAFSNPFTIGIAQGIAELPPFSGMAYRLVVWAVLTLIAIYFITKHAKAIKKPVEDHVSGKEAISQMSVAQRWILVFFVITLGLLIYGVGNWDWYINEIAALFLGLGLLSGLVSKLNLSEATEAFTEGAKDMITAALVIGLSKGLLIIASEGRIIDTILYTVATGAQDFPNYVSIEIMFFVQSFLNFFIPSGSGQAALTMPIMAPLGDLLGLSRQTVVLAFQFGDGLSNMIIPTSGVTMGVLAIAKIPYENWIKWAWPMMLTFFIAAMILLLLPVLVFEWGPF